MRKIFILFGSVFLLFFLHLLYLFSHREFQPKDFIHDLTSFASLKLPTLRDKDIAVAKEILHQPFHYLAKGRQMTAFESEDGKYVLKFFNPRRPLKKEWFFRLKKLGQFCSLKSIKDTYFRKKDRLSKLFHRYQMAFDELKEESALIYVHIHPSSGWDQRTKIKDINGREELVSLSNTPFILQKKVILASDALRQSIAKGETEKTRELIQQLVTLFKSRVSKGFTDRIQTLHNNYGFIDGHAVQIDLGRIKKNSTIFQDPKPELERVLGFLKNSLLHLDPNFSKEFANSFD